MSGIRIEGGLDPTMAWDGERLYDDASILPGSDVVGDLRGGAGWVRDDDANGTQIVRDPLGINKLFWVRDGDGSVAMAARPARLVGAGYRFEDVRAIPPGTVLDSRSHPRERSIVPERWFATGGADDQSAEAIGAQIRASVMSYLEALASARPGQVFVCLSGGLDSSGVAAFAREVFSDTVAVSFDLKQPGGASDDRIAGERVAKDLGMPLLERSVNEDELIDRLDSVLVEGTDWRDFNVHAALVNAALADAIASVAESPLVLTGDLANEFLVDYEPESYRGSQYYRLPRLHPAALRASLVRGLDTCNRELGIFAARGLRLVQPYAVAVDQYLSLPEGFLELDDRKPVLSRIIFGTMIPEHVYTRKKVRAQVGSESGGGVLGVCLDRGIDQTWLRRRFCELHGIEDTTELDRFIRAGRYRSEIPMIATG